MPAAAWRRISQRPATLSDICRRKQIAGTCSSRSKAPASLSDLTRVPQISSPCTSRSTSAQAAAWTSPTLSSSSRGWWRRHATWTSRIHTLHEQARFSLSGLGHARQFGTADQPQREATKQHLYLVLDDQEDEFSIHKLDMDNDLDVGCISAAETPLLLPEPPVLRIGSRTVAWNTQFAAIGSHIIAISPFMRRSLMEERRSLTLTFDTKTKNLIVSYALPDGLLRGYDTAIAVRDRLYFFESFTDNHYWEFDGSCIHGGLHCLAAGPCVDETHWAWQPLSDPSPFVWSWSARAPQFPFDPKKITGHVVHPKTGTIFVSAHGQVSADDGELSRGTFSYDMGGSGQWKFLGDWLLPFEGPTNYDGELDAWVGLDRHGYFCACSVMSGSREPNWKVHRKELFLKHPYWSHVGAKLVHMGERSKYCLVERLLPEGADKEKYVLRLTMFIVKYDEDGDLKIMAHQPARFYKAPSYGYSFDIQAFWM